ncbi:MAG: molybdopterin-dependent oxidoreductase [Desulfarculaceae bacterium]|jgi:anaerobic selenocysteine-containing dehydrogenase
MEWDRRAFVKFAVGAVMGIGASPLIPKLQDDVAIWTQNWSWVPNPETGALAFASSVNPATGTGVRARIVEGRLKGERAIRVEGNPEHPLCRGGVLAADASALQLFYSDAMRVGAPILRESRTGIPGAVSAKKALAALTKKLGAMSSSGKAGSLVILADKPDDTVGEMLKVFAAAYGTPHLYFTPSAAQTLALAGRLMLGQENLGFDLENSDCIVSLGTPLLEGFGAPVVTRKAFAAWRQGPKQRATLVQVEPRASISASQADIWLACKPGTEGAVAMGLCHLLIKAGTYDKSLAGQAHGFEDLPEGPGFKSVVLKDYSPAQVEKISGVPAAKLQKVAQAFTKAKKPLAICGPDDAGGPGRLYDFMAVLALNALAGNLGKPGGVVVRSPLPLKSLPPAADATKAGAGLFPEISNPCQLAQAALEGKVKVEAVLAVGTNPVFNGPQAGLMKKFLESVPLVAAITPYHDETASLADVVLPAGAFLEAWGDCPTPYGSPVASYGLHRPLVSAIDQSRSSGDWVLELLRTVGGKLPFKSMEELLKARTEEMGDFEELSQKSFWVQEKPAYGAVQLQTPSGKLEFVSQALHKAAMAKAGGAAGLGKLLKEQNVAAPAAQAFMPHYEAPKALSQVGKEYPLLMAAQPSLRTSSGSRPVSPYMVKILSDTTLAEKDRLVVEINPETAAGLHLKEGDQVKIHSASGDLEAKVHLFAGAAPGMVFVPLGLGHTAMGQYLEGKGGNFQEAVVVTSDALSGTPQWGLTPVRLVKAGVSSHG